MSGRDDRAADWLADWLADHEAMICGGCGGTGNVVLRTTMSTDIMPCRECGGRGYWKPVP